MLHYVYNKSTVSFLEKYRDILTKDYRIAGKIGHTKMKKKGNQNYKERHYIINI